MEKQIFQDLNISVITIDGGAGSGKSSTSEILAKKTGFHHLDSGIYFRALGLKAARKGINFFNHGALVTMAENLDIRIEKGTILLDGEECTEIIKSPNAGKLASMVSPIRLVREAFLPKQLSHRRLPGLVANGRDMGEIFDTPMRFFLEVSPEERAKRKFDEIRKKSLNADLKIILAEIIERDRIDRIRTVSPLKPHPKAKIIRGNGKTAEEIAHRIFFHCVEHLPHSVVFKN